MKKVSHHRVKTSAQEHFPKKIVYLIGLPGVGKTTTAVAIAKKSGFALFDHNVTYKEICCFIKGEKIKAHLLNGKIHLLILNSLLKSRIPGVVCTISIRRDPTVKIVSKAIKLINKMNAQVNFVQLQCDWDEHKKRVRMPSRRKLAKVNSIGGLKKYMTGPCFTGLKKYPPLVINNTNISADKCAEKIISAFKLNKR